MTDAAILAGRVDASLVVVTAAATHRRRLQQALDTLAQVVAPLSGLVLNAACQEAGYGYSYRYGYTYSFSPSSPSSPSSSSPAEPRRGRKAEQPVEP